jgi:hypothetical protein
VVDGQQLDRGDAQLAQVRDADRMPAGVGAAQILADVGWFIVKT